MGGGLSEGLCSTRVLCQLEFIAGCRWSLKTLVVRIFCMLYVVENFQGLVSA